MFVAEKLMTISGFRHIYYDGNQLPSLTITGLWR